MLTQEERSKSGKKSRNKGANFERLIANQVSNWWGQKFRRTPLSGGWGEEVARGDLVCAEKETNFPFAIECKNDNSFSLNQLLKTPTTGPVVKWWGQAVDQSEEETKPYQLPLLLIKENGGAVYAVVRSSVYLTLFEHGDYGALLYFDQLTLFPFQDLLTLPPEKVLACLENLFKEKEKK